MERSERKYPINTRMRKIVSPFQFLLFISLFLCISLAVPNIMKKRANNLDRIVDFESEEKLAAEVKDIKPFHADSDDINDYDNDDDDLDVSNDRKAQQAKERLQKLQREKEERERIEKEKKEKELQEKLEKEKQQKQKEQEQEEKEKELKLKLEREKQEKEDKERKDKEEKDKHNNSYSHKGKHSPYKNKHKGGKGNHHDNHNEGYGENDSHNHKGGHGEDDHDNYKGGYGHQDDDNHKGGYGEDDHKGGYGHQDDDDGYGHKGYKGHQDDDDGYGHKGYKGHKGGYGHHDDDDDGYGHHGKKCNSNLDCTHLTSSLCSKGVCVRGYCQKSSTNVTHLECCRDEDCNQRSDWNLDKRINSRDYPELEECNAGKCQGGVFNEKGELITSPTCSRRENCCINKEWDNYCNWPGGQATWSREACKGENCQVSTWGAIYSYPIPRHTPNFPDIVPRFLFKKNWVSLYKKLIIVALNVENQFNMKKIFVQRSQSTLVSKLNEIEDFLKSACSIWSKLDPQCSIPDGITPFPFIGLLDFTNSSKFSQYDHFLDSILSGNYSGLPFCSHNHHY